MKAASLKATKADAWAARTVEERVKKAAGDEKRYKANGKKETKALLGEKTKLEKGMKVAVREAEKARRALRKEHPKFNNQAARALEKLHKEGAKIVEGMKTEVERDVHSQV